MLQVPAVRDDRTDGLMSSATKTALAALLVSAALVSSARAQPAPIEPIRIEYRAVDGCPSEAWFEAQVLARTSRARLGGAAEGVRVFTVVLDGRGEVRGRLVVHEPTARGGAGPAQVEGDASREVEGNDCGAVASALALIVALTLDPNAVTTPVLAPVSTPRPRVIAPQPEAPEPDPATLSPLQEPARHRARVRASLGANASLAVGVTSAPLPGGLVFLEVTRQTEAFSSSVRLSLERSFTGLIDFQQGAATFTRTLGALDACPWRWAWGRVDLAPCAAVEAGALRGDGSDVPAPAHPTRAWVAVGASARATLDIHGPLFADLGAGILFPLLRDGFYFVPDPSKIVSQPEPAGFHATLGVGSRFP